LIVADNCNESRKIQVAAKWGLPIVRLQWLLDSIQQGEPLCEDAYIIKVTRTDTTPSAIVPAPRPPPRLSSHHGSNRTPLQPVTEQLANLTFTPKESGNFKSPVPMEIQQKERITSPQSRALLKTKLSPGETPTASPCRTELPSEMAVVIDEDYCSPSMIRAPETELETDDEEEDESDEQQVVAVAADESSAGSVSVSSQSKQKSGGHYWCDNQDSLWVPGSQPRTVETPLTPEPSLEVEEEEEKSFSFGIPADAPDYGTAPLLPSQTPFLLPEETPWMPLQVPAFTDKEEEEEKENETPPPLPLPSPVAEEMLLPEEEEEEKERTPDLNSMTPLSDMTPIDLQQPDLTNTRIADSPSSEDGSSESKDVAENIQHCFSPVSTAAEHIVVVGNGIHETTIQHGGQPEPEWWEDGDEEEDWGCVDIIDETNGGGCTSPPREQEDKTTRKLDSGHGLDNGGCNDDINEEDGEEPSPISIACSNQDDNDDGENELEDYDLPLLPLPLSPQQQNQQQKQQQQQQQDDEIESESQRDEFSVFSESEDQIARFVRARAPLPPLPPLPSGLPQPEDDAVPLKVLQRAPRGSTVKARYRLASTKTVTFSETIHLRGKQLTLNVKDRQQAVVLASLDLDSDTDEEYDEDDLIIVEPVSFYRCQGEDTQMEYFRLFTLKQALSLAEKAGVQLRLPPGFDASVELLKSTAREHVDVRKVTGTVAVRKAKLGVNALKTKSAQGGKPGYYWRCEFDADVPEVLIP
jgi:hypothetical protein